MGLLGSCVGPPLTVHVPYPPSLSLPPFLAPLLSSYPSYLALGNEAFAPGQGPALSDWVIVKTNYSQSI